MRLIKLQENIKILIIVTVCLLLIQVDRSQSAISFKAVRQDLARIVLWHRNFQFHQDDRRLTTPEHIARAGFPNETHVLTSNSGYNLTIHRIPYLDDENRKQKRPVVLLSPGFLTCSDCWFANTEENDLPFLLSRSGFDVWMSSPRGCEYSREHRNLEPRKKNFWNFGFHEIAVDDMPLTIDYILKKTGQKKLNFIGHSMGATVQYVLLSMKPEYNEKINMTISLAPVVFARHMSSPIIRIIALMIRLFPDTLVSNFFSLGSQELWPRSDYFQNIFRHFCENEERRELCMAFVFLFVGFDYCQSNLTRFEDFINVFPAGTSAQAGVHFAQLMNTDTFRQFDYGPVQNLMKYKSLKPPVYQLDRVTAPQILFWSENDWFADPGDVEKLANSVPGFKESCRVRFRRWNHFDYISGRSADQLVNQRVLRVLNGESCHEPGESDKEDDKSINCEKSDAGSSTPYGSLLKSFERMQRNWRNTL